MTTSAPADQTPRQAASRTATPRADAPREIWPAVKLGLMGRCPACGQGKLFRKFLKVMDHCDHCGTEFHHHRADDLPPYLTIFIVGHIVIGGMVVAETEANWPLWLHIAIWPALTLLLSLGLMQPMKGAVVAFQWALRMHGFGGRDPNDPPTGSSAGSPRKS